MTDPNSSRTLVSVPRQKPQDPSPAELFGRYAAKRVHELISPLEILSHTIYLANKTVDDPGQLRQYLRQAEEQVRIIANAKRDLLDQYEKHLSAGDLDVA